MKKVTEWNNKIVFFGLQVREKENIEELREGKKSETEIVEEQVRERDVEDNSDKIKGWFGMNVLYGIYTREIDGQDFLRVETASLFHFVDADSASASHITLHCKTKIQSKLQTH